MAICQKCMTGFDSSLQKCPKCNSVYRPRAKRLDRSTIGIFLFFLLLGIGLSISAFIVYSAIDSSFLTVKPEFDAISISSIFKSIAIGICCYGIFWSYQYANRWGDSGYSIAFVVAALPITGLILILRTILVFDLLNLLLTGLYCYVVFWSYLDASKRGKPGCLVALLVATMPVMGLVSWLIFRP